MEEDVVKFNNRASGTPVGVLFTRHSGILTLRKLTRHGISDKRGIGVAEAIDALFGIADDKVVFSSAIAFVQQGEEVFPLKAGGVLKLVDEKMVEVGAETFVDKRGVVFTNDAAEHRVGLTKLNCIVSVQILLHHSSRHSDQTQIRNLWGINFPMQPVG